MNAPSTTQGRLSQNDEQQNLTHIWPRIQRAVGLHKLSDLPCIYLSFKRCTKISGHAFKIQSVCAKYYLTLHALSLKVCTNIWARIQYTIGRHKIYYLTFHALSFKKLCQNSWPCIERTVGLHKLFDLPCTRSLKDCTTNIWPRIQRTVGQHKLFHLPFHALSLKQTEFSAISLTTNRAWKLKSLDITTRSQRAGNRGSSGARPAAAERGSAVGNTRPARPKAS